LVAIILVIIFLGTNLIASLAAGFSKVNSLPTPTEETALVWISQRTSVNAVIFATLEEGPFVATESSRTAFIDSDFLLVPDVNRKFDDAVILWEGGLSNEASDRLNAYGITHLYISPAYVRDFNKDAPSYLSSMPEGCISLVYNQSVKIYEWRCAALANLSADLNLSTQRVVS